MKFVLLLRVLWHSQHKKKKKKKKKKKGIMLLWLLMKLARCGDPTARTYI